MKIDTSTFPSPYENDKELLVPLTITPELLISTLLHVNADADQRQAHQLLYDAKMSLAERLYLLSKDHVHLSRMRVSRGWTK